MLVELAVFLKWKSTISVMGSGISLSYQNSQRQKEQELF